MIRIYEIEIAKLQKIKNVLEAQDTATGELDIELEKEAGKKGSAMEKAKAWRVNEWKKNGYILREAKAIGIDKKVSFLYVSAPEDFFERNEKQIVDLGANELKGEEFEKVKTKIEEAEQGASEGIGFIFG
ncbi:MAG: hypothetical protein ACPLXC_01225 [Candidatus Pacearchaeota archaeon]